MNIFNSLGSNYNLRFALKTLFAVGGADSSGKLRSYLEERYQGKAVFLYKGREAIEMAIELLDLPKNTSVAINGYTCYAVYKAIVDAGCKVEYLDIEKSDLNFSPERLTARLKENPGIKAVIIQNTLGYPCNIEEIVKICKQKNIVLIEDLAHSVGSAAGTVGDFTVLSFSQDKMIDAVSGGALIIRNKKYQNTDSIKLSKVPFKQQLLDRFYPSITYKIRTFYAIGLGKYVHFLAKALHILSNPMKYKSSSKFQALPDWYCGLVYGQFQELENNLNHRKEIAKTYSENINSKLLSPAIVKDISNSTNLRFPIFLDNREELIQYLKTYGVYVSDIWYDAPVAPKNQCPEAEKTLELMLNLPTHRNISIKQAKEIAERINEWQKSQ